MKQLGLQAVFVTHDQAVALPRDTEAASAQARELKGRAPRRATRHAAEPHPISDDMAENDLLQRRRLGGETGQHGRWQVVEGRILGREHGEGSRTAQHRREAGHLHPGQEPSVSGRPFQVAGDALLRRRHGRGRRAPRAGPVRPRRTRSAASATAVPARRRGPRFTARRPPRRSRVGPGSGEVHHLSGHGLDGPGVPEIEEGARLVEQRAAAVERRPEGGGPAAQRAWTMARKAARV